ncbi:MAG: response regulator [Vulcanimicrobiota bacterium]
MNSRRALLIEDDPSWREILRELLEDCGFEVDQTDKLEEATELIRGTPHRLAIVDLSLGGPDHRNQEGLAVLEAIQRSDPTCQAILLTGFATVELAVQVITEKKAVTCLRKESFSRAEFRELISQQTASAPRLAAPSAPPRTGRLGEALVVEDDAGWRALLVELLSDCGLTCTSCSSFAEARGHLARQAFSLALVDLTLASSLSTSNQDGFGLLAVAREAGIPTIVVSGTSPTETIERAFRDEQVLAFFEKRNFDRNAFCQQVASSLKPSELESLTEREREVLDLLAAGLTNIQIGEKLFISANTVKRHLKAVFEKLGVNNRAAAAALVTRESR